MQKIVSFVLSEGSATRKGGEALAVPISESAPHYFGSSVPRQLLMDKEERKVGGKTAIFEIKSYAPDVLVAEAQVEVGDIFSEDAFDLRAAMIAECHKALKRRGGRYDMSEEYSIAIVSDYSGDPDQFLNKKRQIAQFLKSEKLPLDDDEVERTLSAQLKYAQNDWVVADWDGAFVFDPYGEYESVVELLQIANLQLLRYRMLDSELDTRLKKISRLLQSRASNLNVWKTKEITQAFKDVIAARSRSIAEFEAIDRDIKLIGEWYSARLYDLAAEKLRLSEWKEAVKEKLDSLEDVYSIVAENFSMSRVTYLEFIQIILFFILQLGWFALIILEIWYYTK
jgi:hypothetical protein